MLDRLLIFLFPLLSISYGSKVLFTMFNLVAFIFVDSIGDVILALMIHFITRINRMSMIEATTISILLLWTIFWIVATCITGSLNIKTMCIGASIAFIT